MDDLTERDLVAPIVVVDITSKALADPNAMVEPADLIENLGSLDRVDRVGVEREVGVLEPPLFGEDQLRPPSLE